MTNKWILRITDSASPPPPSVSCAPYPPTTKQSTTARAGPSMFQKTTQSLYPSPPPASIPRNSPNPKPSTSIGPRSHTFTTVGVHTHVLVEPWSQSWQRHSWKYLRNWMDWDGLRVRKGRCVVSWWMMGRSKFIWVKMGPTGANFQEVSSPRPPFFSFFFFGA